MGLKKHKPYTPSRRHMVLSDFADITTDKPERSLIAPKKQKAGLNSLGRVTVRPRGGGHKRGSRIIDFKGKKTGIPANVATIEYDPNRAARIALLHYADGEKRYIIAPLKLSVGDTVMSGPAADIKPGNTLPLGNIPLGTHIHNIELRIGKGGQIVRTAGSFAQLMAKESPYALIKLPSGEVRKVLLKCKATIGQIGNTEHENISLGKAGRKRWLGLRPKVRGVAMNPVDHPMGAGEGKSSGGRHPCTPWGMPTKGYKTRGRKPSDKDIVKKRS